MDKKSISIVESIWYMILSQFLLIIPITIGTMILSFTIGFQKGHPLVGALESILVLILLIKIISIKKDINIKENMDIIGTNPLLAFSLFLLAVGLGIILSDVDNYLRTIIPMPDFFIELFREQFGGEISMLGTIVSVVIVAPIIEEILYRGIILKGFLNRYSVKKSIIISALIFAVAHGNPWQFIGAFAAGIVLGWIFYKTRSLINCILLHMFFNSQSYVISLLGVDITGYTTSTYEIIEYQTLWFNLIGIVVTVVGFLLLNKSITNNKNVNLDIESI